ncbi:MAG: hypothetical protein A2Y38_03640 [Spirochaetes bacterium GWB1_59_5]|nr:MAG: hypothetical protein A2Y38_03640 [Spirochaetes bacterium GWB1_59_5]
MRIKSALTLSTFLSIIIVLTLGITTSAFNLQIRKVTAHLAMTRNMKATIAQRSILGVEFYIRGENRPLEQANLETERLESLFEQMRESFEEAEHASILLEMVSTNDSYVKLFDQFKSSIHAGIDKESGGRPHSDYEKTLYSQIQLKSYMLQALAESLETWHLRRIDSLNTWTTMIFSISLFILIIFVLVNSIWISNKLSTGVERLRQGATLLGGGDLTHRLSIFPEDEIADVAREINMMAESLAISFTSIRNLEHEVAQREQAEGEIRSINAGLEERIAARTAQLESVNKELEAFAYSVAHDLRAPLRSIDGFTRILQEEYEPVFDDEARRLLGIIRASSVKMDSMIHSLLELTRTGKSEFSPTDLDMRSLAIQVFAECSDPELVASFEFDAGALPDAFGDRLMMERVWLNLLSNAVKYSAHSPVRRIEVRGNVDDGMNVYSVRDHGAGFDQRYVGKLFGTFHRLHCESEFAGSGIGLSIVKKIIERHGGAVWAEGRVNDGATFSFSLPRRS